MKKLLLAASFAALLATGDILAEAPKREFRSTWMAGMNIDWPFFLDDGKRRPTTAEAKQQLIDYLDQLKAQNFTTVCLHVRPRADAYYKSTLEPWSGDLTGTRGKDPGYDPLAFALEECHKRGLECYAWVNPYRISNTGAPYNTAFDKEWAAKGWTIRNATGKWIAFNPGIPEARKHCLDVIKEIYTNYDIDGMLFDDYFYPDGGMPGYVTGTKDEDADDYQLWKDLDPGMSLYDWRRHNVNTFVKELYDEIQKTRPDMRFGIGPAGVSYISAAERGFKRPNIQATDWQYDQIYSDPLQWLEDGTIDFISPQIYWARSNSYSPYEPLVKWWSEVAKHYNRHNYTSVASYKVETAEFSNGNPATGWAEISAQIDLTRQHADGNTPGVIYYNTKTINGPQCSGLGDYISTHNYTRRALVPVVDWKQRVNYPAVADLKYSGSKLTWTATKAAEKAIIRYTVYAIPSDVDVDEAKAADGDGFNADYLVDVTYSPSFTLPSDKASGHWYAVCVYDGYGFESDPSIANYSGVKSDATTLVSPKGGTTVSWNVTLKWNAVSGSTYTVQVATDSEFRNLVMNSTTTATEAVMNCDELAENTLCYWRVRTQQEGKLAVYSETETFRSPSRQAAPAAKLGKPADKADIEDTDIVFEWSVSGDDIASRLEIDKASGDFSAPVVSRQLEPGQTSIDVRTAVLGQDTFKWRIVTGGKRYKETTSEVRSFTVTNLSIGSYEKGYYIKTDNSSYSANNKLEFENLWYRSAHSPWNNMSFVENGSLQRGLAATKTSVYVSGRSTASNTADIYLSEYSAETGEHIRDIMLGEEGKISYLPCNDVIKDSEGNILISNMSLNIASTPVQLHLVNLTDGSLTNVATLSGNDNITGRIDHVGVYGDVRSGNFTVFGAVASTANVIRWKVSDGVVAAPEMKTFTKFYPTTSTTFGIAPRVFPISDTQFYADGHATAWTLYSFDNTKSTIGSFAVVPDLAPSGTDDNGAVTFKLGTASYAVYSSDPYSNDTRFSLVKIKQKNYAGMQRLWLFPANGLGDVRSGTCSTPVDAVVMSENTAHIYTYSPGNGLAAYRLVDRGISGVTEIETAGDRALELRVSGRTVYLSDVAENIYVYNLTGAVVATANDCDIIEIPTAGSYIVNADGKSKLVIVK